LFSQFRKKNSEKNFQKKFPKKTLPKKFLQKILKKISKKIFSKKKSFENKGIFLKSSTNLNLFQLILPK